MRPILCSILLAAATAFCHADSPRVPLDISDADGKPWHIGFPGPVLVLISSTPSTQQRTRDMGAALDEFQGRPDFRALVVVDLRGSIAHIAKGYTVRRIRKDLDKEAERIRPSYLKNGNASDPRADIGAIADFDGTLCRYAGWAHEPSKLRVTVLGRDGRIAAHFDQAEPGPVRDAVFELLKSGKSPKIPAP